MSTDRRSCFRISTSDVRNGTLVAHGIHRKAVILNESARGFAILLDPPSDLQIDEFAELEADGAWNRVRVVRTDDSPDGYKVGLVRLSDDDRDAPFVSVHWRSILPRWLTLTPAALIAVLVVFVVAALLGTLSLEFLRAPIDGEPRVEGSQRRARPQPARAGSQAALHAASPSDRAGRGRRALPAEEEATRAGQPLAGAVMNNDLLSRMPAPHVVARLTALAPERLQNWRDELASLPWSTSELAGVLTLDLAHLNLSAAQQERIAEIVRTAVARLRNLAASGLEPERQARQADELQREAVVQITSIFSTQQLAEWRSLSAQFSPSHVR